MKIKQIEIEYHGRKLKLPEVKCPMCGEIMAVKNIDFPLDGEMFTQKGSPAPVTFLKQNVSQIITMQCLSGCVEEMRLVSESVVRLALLES
jgi:hypothetical protein